MPELAQLGDHRLLVRWVGIGVDQADSDGVDAFGLEGSDDLGQLAERMKHYGVPMRDDGRTLEFDDPWVNVVRASAAG